MKYSLLKYSLLMLAALLLSVFQPSAALAQPRERCFDAVSYCLADPIRSYWERHGGLERFGYPITERMSEQIEGQTYAVQYFERRRMEEHPELAGTRYEILLGLLGTYLAQSDSCIPLAEQFEPTAYAYRDILGCPGAPSRELVGSDHIGLREVPMVIERFEGGMMLWVREFQDVLSPGAIFVITLDPSGQMLVWQRFADEWSEGQPTGVVDKPPEGRYAPVRGFGYLWANNGEVRARLGWAIEPEAGETGGYRRFAKGFLLYRPTTDRFYLVTDDRIVRDVPRL